MLKRRRYLKTKANNGEDQTIGQKPKWNEAKWRLIGLAAAVSLQLRPEGDAQLLEGVWIQGYKCVEYHIWIE